MKSLSGKHPCERKTGDTIYVQNMTHRNGRRRCFLIILSYFAAVRDIFCLWLDSRCVQASVYLYVKYLLSLLNKRGCVKILKLFLLKRLKGLGVTICIYWMNMLIRHLVEFTGTVSEPWRQTSSNAIRREKSSPTLSQPAAKVYSSSCIPSITATVFFNANCSPKFPFLSFIRVWALLILQSSSWLSIPAGRDCWIITVGLARWDRFHSHLSYRLLPLPAKHTSASNPSKSFWIYHWILHNH